VLSPDGKTALSSQRNNDINLWGLAENKVIRSFRGHTGSVTALSFSADGKTFLSGGQDGTIRLWAVADGRMLWGMNLEGDPQYPTYPQYGNDVRYVAFMPNGRAALSAQRDGGIRLWDVQSGKQERAFRTAKSYLWSAAISPDGTSVVSTTADRGAWTIHLWDVGTGEEVSSFRDIATASYAAMLRDGKTILTGGHKSLRLWDAASGRLIRTMPNPTLIDSVALSPDGKTTLVGSAYGGNGVISVWDVSAGRMIRQLKGHTDRVSQLSFSSDSATALSSGLDQAIIKWEIQTGRLLNRIRVR
jgi:WD40 repeat protein